MIIIAQRLSSIIAYINEWQIAIEKLEQSATINQNNVENQKIAFAKINNQVNYLHTLLADKGINGWLINERVFKHLLSPDDYSRQSVYELYAILFMLLILAAVFSYEKKNNMYIVLHTTARGRSTLFSVKLASILIATAAIWLIVYGFEFIYYNRLYGFTCLNAPIQSLSFLYDIDIPCTILEFIAIVLIIRFIVLLSLSLIVSYLSIRFNTIKTIIFSVMIFLLPEFLFRLNIQTFKYFSVVRILNVTSLLLKDHGQHKFTVSFLIVLLSGFIVLIMTKKDWCRKQ